jgi:hypothetical protein
VVRISLRDFISGPRHSSICSIQRPLPSSNSSLTGWMKKRASPLLPYHVF